MKNINKNKKAQTEMMGLVILVVLIVIGLMFYVRFAILGQQAPTDTSLDLQRAIFIAGALSKVDICENTNLQQAIAACDNQEQVCSRDSCEMIKEEVPKIVSAALGGEFDIAGNKTVDSGKMFSFYVMQKDKTLVEAGKCPGKKGTVGSYPFKSDITSKEYVINYKLC